MPGRADEAVAEHARQAEAEQRQATGRSPPGWSPCSASGSRTACENSAPADYAGEHAEPRRAGRAPRRAKPQTAPITIMPSTPRLSTPERSTTSSPSAAISSGVAAVAMVSRMLSACPWSGSLGDGLRRAETGNADAVEDQRVAGEHEEQQHALEDARHLVGNADRPSGPARRRDRSAPARRRPRRCQAD